MNPFFRWLRFNLVGAMGMAVQLVCLGIFNAWMHGHYLLATAAAIEVTLVHNFTWHLHYTWRDRCSRAALAGQFLRFHFSNGLISMLGNLILMRLLVQDLHVSLMAANSIAIVVCSIINFLLGDHWVFCVYRSSPTMRSASDSRTAPSALS